MWCVIPRTSSINFMSIWTWHLISHSFLGGSMPMLSGGNSERAWHTTVCLFQQTYTVLCVIERWGNWFYFVVDCPNGYATKRQIVLYIQSLQCLDMSPVLPDALKFEQCSWCCLKFRNIFSSVLWMDVLIFWYIPSEYVDFVKAHRSRTS